MAKSPTHDRLIVNPTVVNDRTFTLSQYSRTSASGSLITMLSLRQHEALRFSADDLSEYYYTYKITPQRCRSNAIRCLFEPEEVQHLAATKSAAMHGKQMLCLNSLAMGDCLSVEVGRAADFRLLREHASALLPAETLLYRQPSPKGSTCELLAIDDHVVLQKAPLSDLPKRPVLRALTSSMLRVRLTATQALCGTMPSGVEIEFRAPFWGLTLME